MSFKPEKITNTAIQAAIAAAKPFKVTQGGMYLVEVLAASYGSVQLNKIGPDGSTALTIGSPFTANGGQFLYLAPGDYTLTLGGATVVVAEIVRVPQE